MALSNDSVFNNIVYPFDHPDDQTQPSFEMTPGFKPFTDCLHNKKVFIIIIIIIIILRTNEG